MDIVFQNGLALLAVLCAVARAVEQTTLAIRRHRRPNLALGDRRVSMLAPAASVTALAYAHTMAGAEGAVLVAAWFNATAVLASWIRLPGLSVSPREPFVIGTREQAHE